MNAETILNATRGVLQQRGRHVGDYSESDNEGPVCVLGAMGVAAGFTPDYWGEVESADPDAFEPQDFILLEAGRLLAKAVDPDARTGEFAAHQVIDTVSRWHDGPHIIDSDRYPNPASNAAVYAALAEAARLAEQAGASA